MRLVWPSREYLPSYVAALERGWLPDNTRGEAEAREELTRIAAAPEAYLPQTSHATRRAVLEVPGPFHVHHARKPV